MNGERKKLFLAAAVALVFALAAIFAVRQTSLPSPRADAASSPGAAQGSLSQSGLPRSSASAIKGDPDLVKKIMQRHDEQLRARQDQHADRGGRASEEEVAAARKDFWDSLADEPGVRKYGALARATLSPGETLLTGGWTRKDGSPMVVFVTPTWVDPAGNKIDGPFNGATPELAMDIKFASVLAEDTERLGLGNFLASDNKSTVAVNLSASQAASLINDIQQSSGANMLSMPRVTTEQGRQVAVSMREDVMIAGKNQTLGPSVDMVPGISQDGASVNLGVIVRYSEAATSDSQQ